MGTVAWGKFLKPERLCVFFYGILLNAVKTTLEFLQLRLPSSYDTVVAEGFVDSNVLKSNFLQHG